MPTATPTPLATRTPTPADGGSSSSNVALPVSADDIIPEDFRARTRNPDSEPIDGSTGDSLVDETHEAKEGEGQRQETDETPAQ
jgi:hypothetical protein